MGLADVGVGNSDLVAWLSVAVAADDTAVHSERSGEAFTAALSL